jgi:hypothetical protein
MPMSFIVQTGPAMKHHGGNVVLKMGCAIATSAQMVLFTKITRTLSIATTGNVEIQTTTRRLAAIPEVHALEKCAMLEKQSNGKHL